MTAYVIGNGISRKGINLLHLNGMTYGCNALYREFRPDVLVSTDPPISKAIMQSGYAQYNRFHTREPHAQSGARPLNPQFASWSSGPNALALAVEDKHKHIVMLGFDFGSTHSKFNNMYAGTEFYRNSHDEATYSGNWAYQVETLFRHTRNVEFELVVGPETKRIPAFEGYKNVTITDIREFANLINNV